MNIYVRSLLSFIFMILFLIWDLFWLGGNWYWVEGWIFLGLMIFMVLGVYVALKDNPELLKERFKRPYQKGQDMWDKVFMMIFSTFYMAWYLIMPLDSQKYNWSPEFPIWLIAIGVVGFIAGSYLLYLTFKQNTYLVPVVKVQKKQKVVDTGLYAHVRHPMYSSIFLIFFSGAFVLESLFGIYISIALSLMLIIRTFLEEKKLKKDLDGYDAYMKKVKYKFIPHIF